MRRQQAKGLQYLYFCVEGSMGQFSYGDMAVVLRPMTPQTTKDILLHSLTNSSGME